MNLTINGVDLIVEYAFHKGEVGGWDGPSVPDSVELLSVRPVHFGDDLVDLPIDEETLREIEASCLAHARSRIAQDRAEDRAAEGKS